jgi:hypothetical protein
MIKAHGGKPQHDANKHNWQPSEVIPPAILLIITNYSNINEYKQGVTLRNSELGTAQRIAN